MKRCVLIFFSIILFFFSCSDSKGGSLVFTANGEDFVRRGFVDKGRWNLTFDHVFVNIIDPTAKIPGAGEARLPGEFWVDLAAGDASAPIAVVGTLKDVRPGNYQSMFFKLRRRSSGEYKGYSIVLTGLAVKEDLRVSFEIKLNEELDYTGTEGYVGDSIKGLVKAGKQADVEMTFHFDHIFGDNQAAADDHINSGSVGFDFFYSIKQGETLSVEQKELKGRTGYDKLVQAIWSLGHLGEGHCEASNQSSKDFL